VSKPRVASSKDLDEVDYDKVEVSTQSLLNPTDSYPTHKLFRLEDKRLCTFKLFPNESFDQIQKSNRNIILSNTKSRLELEMKKKLISRIIIRRKHKMSALFKSNKTFTKKVNDRNINKTKPDLNVIGIARNMSPKKKMKFKKRSIQESYYEPKQESSSTFNSKLCRTPVETKKSHIQIEYKYSLLNNHMQLQRLKNTLLINPANSLNIILKVIFHSTLSS